MRDFSRYALRVLVLLVGLPIAAVLLLVLYWHAYFAWHWENAARRAAIHAEAQVLMRAVPGKDLRLIPPPPGEGPADIYEPKQIPKVMATLAPLSVSVAPQGVYVMTRAAFDEESGYFVARDSRHFDPHHDRFGSYDPIGDGVWWYHLF